MTNVKTEESRLSASRPDEANDDDSGVEVDKERVRNASGESSVSAG